MKIINIFFSFKVTLLLLALLAIGAGVATFIENDFGTSTARVLVYNNIWYETILVLTTVNLMGIIYKFKMWKNKPRFIFHFSFVVILIGAAITRYAGYEGIMQIKEGTTSNTMLSLEPYLQITIDDGKNSVHHEYQKEFTALGKSLNNFNHKFKFNNKDVEFKYVDYMFAKKGKQATMGLVTVEVNYNGQTQQIRLPGQRAQQGMPRTLDFGETKVTLEYGSKLLTLPFAIKLRDFQLDRYPGSMSPSSYASEVTVIEPDGKSYDYRIFMNRTLFEGNFLFFQSSYFPDETGTVLSVNNDPGKWPTYFGYLLLTIGLLLNFFDKKSRFWKLTKYVSSKNLASFIALVAISFASSNLQANTDVDSEHKNKTENIKQYLEDFKNQSALTADKFSKLVVQSNGGRMKPMSTLNKEIVEKITGKSHWFGLNSDQIILGMLSRPDIWGDLKIIKLKTPKLKKFLEIPETEKYIAFSQAFKDGKYVLASEAEMAFQSKPMDRGTYEKDIIKVDERLNILFSTFNAALLNIYPRVQDGHNHDDNNKWYNPLDAMEQFEGQNQVAVEAMTRGFINSIIDNKWEDANKYVDMIKTYQEKVGSEVNLSESYINNEILFNNLDIFFKLTLAYILLGFVMLVFAFITVFKPSVKSKKLTFVFFTLLALVFATHTFGMAFRWMLSGHAPWSDLYESLLYISWSAVFAGVIFFRRSLLALSAAVIVAGIFMFTAHLTGIDPQITNLVPVLKSYWLTIHVSVLTASYGFFGLGAILGFMTLIMFIFRKNRPHIDENIKNITAINEIALIIGLAAITIGNFLGGVWANESWGRYWGWDPKETWAYVSIVIYAIVVHLRFVKALNTPYVFASASLLAFSSILMTYFGVNFYLSGMHSYATGDPVPIPTWAYYVTAIVIIAIVLAFRNRNLNNSYEN